ncbi:PspC domain-containing protein [Actinoplanes sp. NPDC049599]|uniref:PspC domain-containing protein n=1 Tax=Actinoplanes sp. NPDC049599 TaxID=3363903 RepID=UPI0037B8A6DF
MSTPSITGQNPPTDPASPDHPVRRLRRSRGDRVLGGVCGGLGRYFDVDPVLLRIAAIALVLASGAGVLAYVIAWIVIPDGTGEPEPAPPRSATDPLSWYLGLLLIALGGVLLLRLLVPWFDATLIWPLVIILAGVLVLVPATRDRRR